MEISHSYACVFRHGALYHFLNCAKQRRRGADSRNGDPAYISLRPERLLIATRETQTQPEENQVVGIFFTLLQLDARMKPCVSGSCSRVLITVTSSWANAVFREFTGGLAMRTSAILPSRPESLSTSTSRFSLACVCGMYGLIQQASCPVSHDHPVEERADCLHQQRSHRELLQLMSYE
jgi:hypothetical protein